MDWNGIVDNIAAHVPGDGDTYTGEDGLLHCSRCHGKRQTRILLPAGERVVSCICKCMADAVEQQEQERRKCNRAAALKRYRAAGLPPAELEQWTFAQDDGTDPVTGRAMRAYVEQFDTFRAQGTGLLLYGDVGVGKSFYAGCIVNALQDKGYQCLMTGFSRLANQLMELREGRQQYIDGLAGFDLIAIDDLGVERDTEYMNEQVTGILDGLYRAKVPMIITSNRMVKELSGETDLSRKRGYDRVLERCHPVWITGESRRKQKGRANFKEINRALGL